MTKKNQKNNTGVKDNGEFVFNITSSNFAMLMVMERYTMMLDYVTQSDETTVLNLDGIVNYILDNYLQKHLAGLSKKHGFQNMEEFLQSLSECRDGEEVNAVVKQHEREKYQIDHDAILAQIPVHERGLFEEA